ncbi:MAG: phosphoenolpyruvate carboxylase, partial [Acidobacteriota bacterium]
MIDTVHGKRKQFDDLVGIKFQLYNSLFLSLPFYGVDKTGILLSLFNSRCEEGFADSQSPMEIIDSFFANRTTEEKIDLLFRFVQYTERQVVLFDALEDAAFTELNDTEGTGTLTQLESTATQSGKIDELKVRLARFSTHLVLTAHPTQFYPGAVLGIINDLVGAISENNVGDINTLLQQLGRTPFLKKQKPTPVDEASSLIWYLENVFYNAIGAIASELKNSIGGDIDLKNLIKMGFWSGGDRDGNPLVTSETTAEVAAALKRSILRCYYRDVRGLKRRLTFANVETAVADLEKQLYDEAFRDTESTLDSAQIVEQLVAIRDALVTDHNGLFSHRVDELIAKAEIFGVHFATLDIRQEASEHERIIEASGLPGYRSMSDESKLERLLTIKGSVDIEAVADAFVRDSLKTIGVVRQIQEQNGIEGCHRYIISQCQNAIHVMEVLAIFRLGGWDIADLSVDIVPLFETIADLQRAPDIMRELYTLPAYREHLTKRKDRQTIMLGFSDGTKDGGYLMANWSIYKAKDELTRLAHEYAIDVVFFDGRGGPPARGGGKTHKFYSSMGRNIA